MFENEIDNAALETILAVIPTAKLIRKRGIVLTVTTASGLVMIQPDIAPGLGTYDYDVTEASFVL